MSASALSGGVATLVVIPCYNESRRLDVAAVEAFVATRPSTRLLFVDDGSTDSTASLLRELAAKHPDSISCHFLEVNSGKAEAVRQGMLEGLRRQADVLAYWDADLATPLPVVDDFLSVLEARADLLGVLGSRVQRLGAEIERLPLRHYAGRLFATLASLVLGMAVYDTQCGAKMFRAGPELAEAFAEPFHSRWIFDVEVLARLKRAVAPQRLASRLYELPLSTWRDIAGSKLSTTRAAGAFFELWAIYRKYR